MSGSLYIFRAEMMDLIEALEYVQAYIDDILCITRGALEDHFDKLREVINRLHDTGLKVNTAKSFFCTQQKKVQAILTLNLPNNVKELRHFLGMVQYCRGMWVKQSEMLASLSDVVGECGKTKNQKKQS